MKYLILLVVFTLAFLIGLGGVWGWRWWQVHNLLAQPFSPATLNVDFDPPRQSLTGTVASVSGLIIKDSRDQEEPVTLTESSIVLEDETITSSPSAQLLLRFPPAASVTLEPETIVSLVSTNPKRFLLKLDQGQLTIQTDEITKSLSVRTLHALVMLSQGQATINTNPFEEKSTITVSAGTVQLGFIDSDNKTQMVEIKAGETITFDDDKRLLTVQ